MAYMHTIRLGDGPFEPGHFNGEQIVRGRRCIRLARSLAQIRSEQRAAAEFRRRWKYAPIELGYVRVTAR